MNWRQEQMQNARLQSSNPFDGDDWDDYQKWTREVQTACISDLPVSLHSDASSGKRKRSVVSYADFELPAWEDMVKHDASVAVRSKKTRKWSDDARVNAAYVRASTKDSLQMMHSSMLKICQRLDIRAPDGMTTATRKNPDVGRHGLEGKYTKSTLQNHMPSFLKTVSKSIKTTIKRYDAYVKELHEVLGKVLNKTIPITDVTVDKFLEMHLTSEEEKDDTAHEEDEVLEAEDQEEDNEDDDEADGEEEQEEEKQVDDEVDVAVCEDGDAEEEDDEAAKGDDRDAQEEDDEAAQGGDQDAEEGDDDEEVDVVDPNKEGGGSGCRRRRRR